MHVKVGINGFGRTGRTFFRNLLQFNSKLGETEDKIEVVAINDAYLNAERMAYFFEFDSVHGKFDGKVYSPNANELRVNDQVIRVFQKRSPSEIDWKSAGAYYIIESTGFFNKKASAEGHLKGGAERVIVTAPSDVPIYVCGVNADKYNSEHKIISNGSETTNCAAVLLKILHEKYGIEEGMLTTVHAGTAEQKFVDGPSQHGSDDLRAGRSIVNNIIISDTTASHYTEQLIPDLKGKITGIGFRVPTNVVSVVDLNLRLKSSTSYSKILETIEEAAQTDELRNILALTNKKVVATDMIGCPQSAVVDCCAGKMIGDKFLKLVAWHDNEWGYSRRLCDLLWLVAKRDEKGQKTGKDKN